ncbi:MAG: HlyD family secretion protein [Candidatus Obscuribacterales bacterium]|nr:HlyD family secretion protein [Candidatus Obscuribacterales bacterium]
MTDESNQVQEPISQPPPKAGWSARLKQFGSWVPRDLIPIIALAATIFLVILFANDWKFWDGIGPFETTNDAYVRADVTPLSTKVSGTVSKVLIQDFEQVKRGQVLVELRNDDFIARANQAESLYEQALENINTVSNQIAVQTQHIESARLSTLIGGEDINRATASVGATAASLRAAKVSLEEARDQKAQGQARLKADQAIELRALQEKQRQLELFADKASTQQTVEQVVADYDRQKAVVEADKSDVSRLNNAIAARSADIAKYEEDLKSTHAADVQSRQQLSSRDAQLIAERRQMDVLTDLLKEAKSAAKAKLAAWQEAKVELDYTRIVAPVDGILSERRVRAGQQVNAGTQVVTIVSSVPWVIASYRETQLRKIAVGDKAEVSVDGLGSAVLKGTVQSLSPATEAQFALLPPDNPSGNFTKITQRLPVKIVFNADQKLVQRVKPGMTVIAKVFPHP